MAAYLQQGHGSWGLLEEADIGSYAGVILSPVNDDPIAVANGLARIEEIRGRLEVILDPQLYNPGHDKGQLTEWAYYSTDFETANHGDLAWWSSRAREVVDSAVALGADAICTPAMYRRVFDDAYYNFCVDVADATRTHADAHGVETLLTAIVNLRDLGNPTRALQLASMLSNSRCDRVYLTFLADDIEPRQPLSEAAELASAVHLVRLLSNEMRVHVAFCGHDAILWKFAGATDVSSGKFFNLRRFTPSRWRDDDGGGRQVAYWNENLLATLLRDQEVLRLDREHWFEGQHFSDNPHSTQILRILRSNTGEAWQRLSWLQYLRWLSNADARYADSAKAEEDLEIWDGKWGEIQRKRILFTDRFNDGSHVRTWLNAAREEAAR